MIQSKIPSTLLIDLRPHLVRNTCVLAGWVCPSGSYYKGGSWQHESLARRISGVDKNAAELLLKEGWVRLTDYGHPVTGDDCRLTAAQLNMLCDLAQLFADTDWGKRLNYAITHEVLDE
jgi:hypothetical protein